MALIQHSNESTIILGLVFTEFIVQYKGHEYTILQVSTIMAV